MIDLLSDPHILNFCKDPFGWICPRCRKIYSPNTSECFNCNTVLGAQVNPMFSAGAASSLAAEQETR